ncbi:Glycosyl transferase, group 2 family [Candidatus Sulfopaludibacter sp. SbA4]|nr:Glycosyl transferase, group 2 family [Candidatus Sulfopaludibacter sp. SbA4]
MSLEIATFVFLGMAAIPFIYYGIVLFSCWRFFRRPARHDVAAFTPPVSILKPIRGLDPDAYENFASFCRQDYPDYELLFCLSGRDDSALPLIDRLMREFPERPIRVLFGSGRNASNDKVAKLARLVSEAAHEYVVISDSDVRARPDYLRSVIAPLADPKIGAVTCFYLSIEERSFADRLHSVGMMSDFYAGIVVAWQLDGVKFALGPTIATTRERLAAFGGYESIENRPGDDLLVGRLIADQGCEVELSRYPVETVADYHSMRELMHKRLRWIVVMRHMRPWGHFGLLFTHGLPWALAAVAVHPSLAVSAVYLGGYFAVRCAITAVIAVWGLHQRSYWRKMGLIPLWDALAFLIWVASFARRSIRWRGADYNIRGGALVLAAQQQHAAQDQ